MGFLLWGWFLPHGAGDPSVDASLWFPHGYYSGPFFPPGESSLIQKLGCHLIFYEDFEDFVGLCPTENVILLYAVNSILLFFFCAYKNSR